MLYSLIETALASGLISFNYLILFFEELPEIPEDIEILMFPLQHLKGVEIIHLASQ